MHKRTTPKTFYHAKELRRNLTPDEARLWTRLRANRLAGAGFRRQHAIGKYITDFCSPKHKLIIAKYPKGELDGSHHLEQEEYDSERTDYLKSRGYTVLRFWNKDVLNDIDGVIRVITVEIENKGTTL